jgi:short-subunit dehydrogenase involved in D-alanine esterification of teichoic acids
LAFLFFLVVFMKLIPRPKLGTLYRFLRLDDAQLAALKAGSYQLQMREFSSWAKTLQAAKDIAMKKVGEGHAVIVAARFPSRDLVIDVAGFYAGNHFTDGCAEWTKYVRPEQEVIVAHHAPIRLTTENTTILPGIDEGDHPTP